MFRLKITTIIFTGLLVVLLLCSLSCRKSSKLDEIALRAETSGPAPSAADVIKIAPPPNPVPVSAPAMVVPTAPAPPTMTTQSPPPPDGVIPDGVIYVSHPTIFQHGYWLLLVGILLVLFLLALILFHVMGRNLQRRSFKAHSPTRHVDIWASHKPPQFLDP